MVDSEGGARHNNGLCSNDLVNHKSDFSEWLILDDDENKL
jgi:hypothetical protein